MIIYIFTLIRYCINLNFLQFNFKKVCICLFSGNIVIFHCRIIHGSEENVLGKDRYSLTFTYQTASENSHHRSAPAELIEKEKVINY